MHYQVINSIINILKNKNNLVEDSSSYNNSIQNMGEGLEEFVKDSFCNSFNDSIATKQIKYSDVFSYLGNSNNPPDMILKNGIAVEVKKLEGYGRIALNSSYPKDYINSDDTMLTKEASKIDSGEWSKPLYYYIGTVDKSKQLKTFFIIEGSCYSASKDVYERVKNIIKDGVSIIPNVEFSETKELGRVNKIDPLGITNLRIRGMYDIAHPITYLKDIHSFDNKENSLYLVMSKDSFDDIDEIIKSDLKSLNDIDIVEHKIQNPNNLANLKEIVLIKSLL